MVHTFYLLLAAGIISGAIIAPAAVGFTLQFGVTNYVNFAYGELLTFAAFMVWTFNNSVFHLNLIEAGLVAALLTAIGSLVLGGFVYTKFFQRRPQLLYVLVVTFAVALILESLFRAIWGSQENLLVYPSGSDNAIGIGPVTVTNLELGYLAVSALALLFVHALLRYSKLGRMMRAMSDDAMLAIACGLPVRRTTNVTWAITGFLGGIAGVVLALQSHGFDSTLGTQYVYLIFAAVILGGIGRPYGAILGALIIGLVFQLTALFVGSGLSPLGVFMVLVILMLARPEGLFGSTGRSAFRTA